MSLLGQQADEDEEKESGVGSLLGGLLDNVDVGSLLSGMISTNTASESTSTSSGKKKKKKTAKKDEESSSGGLLGILGKLLK